MLSDKQIPAGKLIVFSSGEYSDYGYEGHFLTLEPFGPADFEEAKKRIKDRITSEGAARKLSVNSMPRTGECNSPNLKKSV